MIAERWWNAPNLLTIARLVLAPVVVEEILAERPQRALLLLLLAALTDFLDGFIARATHDTTRFGQMLDPVADKLLLVGVFLGLGWTGAAPVWFVGLVFGRDFLILCGSVAVLAFTQVRDIKPSIYGKICTIFQILAAGSFLAAKALGGGLFSNLASALVWPAALFTIWSGVHYGWRGLAYFRRH